MVPWLFGSGAHTGTGGTTTMTPFGLHAPNSFVPFSGTTDQCTVGPRVYKTEGMSLGKMTK